MRTYRRAALVLIAMLAATLARGAPPTVRPRHWSDQWLHQARLWTVDYNNAVIRASSAGLRVEIAPGKEWCAAALPNVLLPAHLATVRVRVRELSGAGTWFMRFYGDVRGTGPYTVAVFQSVARPGESTVTLDPRAIVARPDGPPLQVQFGLEGKPGAYAVVESVEFVAARPRGKPPVIPGQRNLACVDLMPNLPQPFKLRDWRAVAQGYDRLAFDFDAHGQYLPLIWLDDSRINLDGPTFGLYSYVGDKRQGGANHEGVTCLGAVLGATLVGIDKTKQQHDYVAMCEAYYNKRNGSNLVLNAMDQGTGGSFWYEIFPHIAFYALADRYPGHGNLDAIMRTTADRWRDACYAMAGPDGRSDFDHTAFDFAKMEPVNNGQWREPDAAAGIAWLEYMAWAKYRDPKYLAAADRCLRFLQRRQANPYYENLLPWGTLAAARLNAELGRGYDVDRFLTWCFGISDCRGGWGVTLGSWGGYDCAGLLGSVDNQGGYAFAMNTFTQAAALVPLVRYDTRYARALGKWMLNLANAARLFYPTELPADHQSCAWWQGDPEGVIAYEGLRHHWGDKSPYATGDPIVMKWGPETDLGLYGSSYVGMLGALVHGTNEEHILALDCLATDFFHAPAYPTWLIYNPHGGRRAVELEVGPEPRDLYDAATGRFLRKSVTGKARFAVAGDRAVVVVVAPARGKLTQEGSKTLIDGVVVRYYGARAPPSPSARRSQWLTTLSSSRSASSSSWSALPQMPLTSCSSFDRRRGAGTAQPAATAQAPTKGPWGRSTIWATS